jgi:Protein of unknown function (DUF2934)
MSTAEVQVYGKAELWRAYREAFREFARRVDELESLKTNGNVNRTSVEIALLELERARVHYRQSRNALASVLLAGRASKFAEDPSSARPQDDNQRVREIAQLLWEFEARREGFAADDWYRAEEIIRSARAADAKPACRASLS